MSEYDVIIIGSGLAGLTAGLFAARYGLSTLVMESNIPGGHLISIEKIEDFPGFPDGVAGYELCPTVQRQAADQGAEFQRAEVQSLEARIAFGRLTPTKNRHLAKAVIVATGSTLKDLGVPGEAKLTGPRRQPLRELRRAALQRPSRRRGRRRRLGAAGSAHAGELRRARSDFSPGEEVFRATYLSPESFERTKDHRRAIEPPSKKF